VSVLVSILVPLAVTVSALLECHKRSRCEAKRNRHSERLRNCDDRLIAACEAGNRVSRTIGG
jgi:hypothetical protein